MEGNPRGYIGICGSILAIIGLFLPYIHLRFFDSLIDRVILISYMAEVNGPVVAVLVIAALIVMLVLNYVRKHNIAAVFSMTLAVLIFIDNPFAHLGVGFSTWIRFGNIGFWLVTIGLIAAILSPFLWTANGMLEKKLMKAK